MSVDRIVRRGADAAAPSSNANSLVGRSFRTMPQLFKATTANMNMQSENLAWGDRPRWMNTIFWSESHESLLCGEPGMGDVVCEMECAGDGMHASIDILPLIISLSRRFSNFSCEFSVSNERIFSIDFFRIPDLFIFALVTPVTRFFSSVILSFCWMSREKYKDENQLAE